jgi:uncharacterized protein (TIGR03905 family)
MFEYKTSGVCSSTIHFDMRDGKLHDLSFEGGCNGNLKGLSLLAEGMDAAEVVRRLGGVQCGRRGTSCPDQLARAVKERLEVL